MIQTLQTIFKSEALEYSDNTGISSFQQLNHHNPRITTVVWADRMLRILHTADLWVSMLSECFYRQQAFRKTQPLFVGRGQRSLHSQSCLSVGGSAGANLPISTSAGRQPAPPRSSAWRRWALSSASSVGSWPRQCCVLHLGKSRQQVIENVSFI